MKTAVIVLVTIMLAACASKYSKRYTGPNGRSAYYVECSGVKENCYPAANERCPAGYKITKLESGLTLSWRDESKMVDKFDMLIECNE